MCLPLKFSEMWVISQAYAEEKQRREAEERKRNEGEVISRWYQLLSSIITRQRLNNCYGSGRPDNSGKMVKLNAGDGDENQSRKQQQVERMELEHHVVAPSSGAQMVEHEHEHVFLTENQTFCDKTSLVIKRCQCGFSIEVEEL